MKEHSQFPSIARIAMEGTKFLSLNVNGFDCKSCGKPNRLFLQFRTAQITEFDENAGVPTMKDAIITEIPK